MFQLTRQTWELWLSNWARTCTSNLVGAEEELSFLLVKQKKFEAYWGKSIGFQLQYNQTSMNGNLLKQFFIFKEPEHKNVNIEYYN